MRGRTLLDKIWLQHEVVAPRGGHPAVLYVDLHLVHEVTSPQAFAKLERRGLCVRRPDLTVATMDHVTPTGPRGAGGTFLGVEPQAAHQLATLRDNCERHGIRLYGADSEQRGIVHVMGPELGLSRPGATIVCGDSHTSTHGAFGALAFGIGTTEVGHVLATQCVLQHRPRAMRVTLEGRPGPCATAKDLALAVVAHLGVDGGTGHVVEYQGEAVRALSMEGRMTLCNMSIEAGARAGLVAPDETTFAYLARRGLWDPRWTDLCSDDDAVFDTEVRIDVQGLEPRITWGIQPAMSTPVGEALPAHSPGNQAAYDYMALQPGVELSQLPVDVVFVGSCTNGRIEDLRDVASILRGRRVAERVRMLVVPGSEQVRRQAESEGLHDVFEAAGAEWRQPGCSMCIAMNGDRAAAGQYVVSTSNRNFPGRQGPGARTLLCSPLTAAATAVTGCVTDPRTMMEHP
ncbi:MAG: 3-isopropylmalate dehydratase large subunit [Myxococcales bacterium]|nr:3-isopropylmalate dehydratase large subunit [Myxococcales bacterium]